MKWSKQGIVFHPTGQHSLMRTHASLPVALRLQGEVYRIYFASRDEKSRSHIWYVELNIKFPTEILRAAPSPVLAPGPLGRFDDHGVFPGSIVEYNRKLFMYYIGWNPGPRQPLFYSSVGLAVSEDRGKGFRKYSSAPILTRSEFDPCLVTSPCVMRDGERWRMWYVSGFRWDEVEAGLRSYYHIKYAESKDGIRWERNGVVCIDLRPGEQNIARPCVIKEDGIYKMWYSYNAGEGYRIGYAESPDGYIWTRLDDQSGISVSESGWDSEALAYPWVFSHEGRKYMLYNGNQFGREGFGLAVDVD